MPNNAKNNAAPVDNRAEQNSLSAINKMVGSIARSAVKLNETIHNCAIMCMEHAREYGTTNPAARLVDAMPMSHRRGLLIKWFAAFSPVTIGKDAKSGNMKAHLAGKAEDRVWELEAAKATPFFAMPDAQREPDVPTYESIHNNVISFVARMERRAKDIADAEEQRKAFAEIDNIKKAVNAPDPDAPDINF